MSGTWTDINKESRRATAINRIARNVAWEIVSQARPKDLARVPPSAEALTPEYLTAVLCKDHPGAKVTDVTLGAASSGSADRCAFSVTYNDAGNRAGLPRELFHKSTKGFYTRLHLLRCGISRNETSFFDIIQPTLKSEIPKPYRADFEERTYRQSIILENVISTKGARFFEVSTPVERSDIEGMLSIIAELHGKYWESPRLEKEFTWLLQPAQFSRNLEEGMELEQLIDLGLQRGASVVSSKLTGRKADVLAAYRKSMDLSTRAPLTYIHGDPHLRNFYKTSAGAIGLADWQVTMHGAWSHDFAYTLLTSLPVEKRRAWERELLEFYLQRVKDAGGRPPVINDAWELYRRQTMYTFVGWLITIGFGPLQPDMQPTQESLEIIRRAATAVDDLNTIALLLG